MRLSDLLSDDTNQFGPGTDLAISILAVLLVISLITSHLYQIEHEKAVNLETAAKNAAAQKPVAPPKPAVEDKNSGNFKLASEFFSAADFEARPVTRLLHPEQTVERVDRIVRDYRQTAAEYPFIFVIGHSSELDDPDAEDRSVAARRRRNMEYALRRAALIAGLLQDRLTESERQRLLAASTGEADLKDPAQPASQVNAWVEVVFGREWKLPGRGPAQ